jgi:hypothetical protein
MREVVGMTPSQVLPTRERLLEQAGIPPAAAPRPQVEELLVNALDLLRHAAEPRGLYASIGIAEFSEVYRGKGWNDPETPLEAIFPEAEALALFAVTLGESLSEQIHRLFESRDFALGHMLDAAASDAVERAGELLEQHYRGALVGAGLVRPEAGLLRYSPGYCGWHMSGQIALFASLNPGEIGIALGESYLMQPLKSMSGVIVAGRREIHNFENNFPFCVDCRDWSCRERIQCVLNTDNSGVPIRRFH